VYGKLLVHENIVASAEGVMHGNMAIGAKSAFIAIVNEFWSWH
jgi:hypothetical protein